MLSQSRLKELLYYEDGMFYWNVDYAKTSKHDLAGYNHKGYICIQLDGREYSAHRLVWLWFYGQFPDGDLDHIDGNRKNNHPSNLRIATKQQNAVNRPASKNNKLGVKNVYFRPDVEKYAVQFRVDNKLLSFGCYVTLEEAKQVAEKERTRLHKEFANHKEGRE